ncbi:SU10 major capsid protein [Sinorhizobium psoraleae]|uniref:SU10 major capsid protein n=1 Tax=Sinorhizobium psoraleae TaxID=520838 RepID=UPI0035E3E768
MTTVEPQETPFFSSIRKGKASNTRHEYLTGTLSAPNPNNAQVEGAAAPDTVATKPERRSNMCQIFARDIRVSADECDQCR